MAVDGVPAGGPFASAPVQRVLRRELIARRHSMTSTRRGRRLVFVEPVPIDVAAALRLEQEAQLSEDLGRVGLREGGKAVR